MFNHQIYTEPGFHDHALIDNWHSKLAFDGEAAEAQFMCEGNAIDRLEKTRSKDAMDLQRGVNDLSGDLVLCHWQSVRILAKTARFFANLCVLGVFA